MNYILNIFGTQLNYDTVNFIFLLITTILIFMCIFVFIIVDKLYLKIIISGITLTFVIFTICLLNFYLTFPEYDKSKKAYENMPKTEKIAETKQLMPLKDNVFLIHSITKNTAYYEIYIYDETNSFKHIKLDVDNTNIFLINKDEQPKIVAIDVYKPSYRDKYSYAAEEYIGAKYKVYIPEGSVTQKSGIEDYSTSDYLTGFVTGSLIGSLK